MEYEINISSKYKNKNCIDEWGAAFVWLDDDHGVEYNYCYDNGKCCSAIYKMEMKYNYPKYPDGYMETDYSTFEHYEIDFTDKDWEQNLVDEMIRVAKKFFWKGWNEDEKM